MVGTGNVQVNNNLPAKPPLNPATLAGLSLAKAIARIGEYSHDDVVDLFATASPEFLTRLLKALLPRDEAMAVAILADLDPNYARVLISPHKGGFSWLSPLPTAAEAIAERAAALKWDHDPGGGRLERAAQSPEGTHGYFRQYEQGCIYWSDNEGGTYAVRRPLAEFHQASGGTSGELGFPMSGEESSAGSRLGTRGTAQLFEGGCIFSSSHGTYSMPLASLEVWDEWLGFPLATGETQGGVVSQRFEGGLTYSSKAGRFAVRYEVAECAGDSVPTSAEEGAHPYPKGRVQRFVEARGRKRKVAVYSSDDTGVHRVVGSTLHFYEEIGGPGSKLGLPVADAVAIRGGGFQRFERGTIYHLAGHSPAAVPAETVELAGDRLGWPVSQEKPVGGSDDETIQYFANGVVTLRGGKREMWLRPPAGPD
jgi:uncharacterized protein with LGFP repeats